MRKLNSIIIILLACFLFTHEGIAQDNLPQAKVIDYLNRQGVLQKYDARLKDKSFPIPKKLNGALLYAFPKHRFTHIQLEAGLRSIVSIPADFILFSDANTGEITGFVSGTYSVASDSFKNLLTAYQATSQEDALNKVLILSELISYSEDNRVGRVFLNGSIINAEVISTFEPYLILKVKINREFKFGKIRFIKAKTGKEEWNYQA